MKRTRYKTRQVALARPGFSFLEFLVAMVVLGIALTGLFPLMVICSRGVESLELRYTTEGNKNNNWFSPVFRSDTTSGAIPREDYGTWYLVPPADPWAAKLGAVATFSRTAPAASPPLTIVDDGGNGYSTTGAWGTITDNNAFLGDRQRHEPQTNPTDAAFWTFSNIAAGKYYVLATWQPAADLATDARFDVYDGNSGTPVATVFVNQTAPSSGSVYSGWQILTTWNFQSPDRVIKVKLSSNANNAVVADGVRIAPVSTILSVDKSFNDEAVSIRVKIGASP